MTLLAMLLVAGSVIGPAGGSGGALSAPVGGGGAGGLNETSGNLLYQQLDTLNTIAADDFFTATTNGVCFEDVDQCIDSDGAGGLEFRNASGTVTITVSTAGVVTFTGGAVFSGVTTDITTAGNEALTITAAGTGSLVLASGGTPGLMSLQSGTGSFNLLTAASAAGARIDSTTSTASYLGQTTGYLGTAGARSATQVSAQLGDNAAHVNVMGAGSVRFITEQVITCAAGVANMDPQAVQISVDSNAAACAITIQETSAAVGQIAIVTVFNVGAGVVTFPDVANVAEIPVLCSTTGIGLNSSLTMMYANRADDLWIATACSAN